MSAISYPIYGTPDKSALDGRFWKCPTCSKGFRQLNGVIAHYHSFHDRNDNSLHFDQNIRPFKCPYDVCNVRPYQNSNGLGKKTVEIVKNSLSFDQNPRRWKGFAIHSTSFY